MFVKSIDMKIHLTTESVLAAQVAELAELKARIAKLNKEIEYHEDYLLSGDGHRCEECGAVRHIDDCVRVGEFYTCSERCAGRIERELEVARGLEAEDSERATRVFNYRR